MQIVQFNKTPLVIFFLGGMSFLLLIYSFSFLPQEKLLLEKAVQESLSLSLRYNLLGTDEYFSRHANPEYYDYIKLDFIPVLKNKDIEDVELSESFMGKPLRIVSKESLDSILVSHSKINSLVLSFRKIYTNPERMEVRLDKILYPFKSLCYLKMNFLNQEIQGQLYYQITERDKHCQ